MPPTPSSARVLGPAMWPVLVSLAAHALLVLLLCLLPGRGEPTCAPAVDTSVKTDILPATPGPGPADPDGSADDAGPPIEVTLPTAPVALPPVRPPPPVVRGAEGRAGSGSGAGDGTSGAGPALLSVPASARSVVYLIDHSLSMGLDDALAAARDEVLASLRRLPPGTRFQIIPYNQRADSLSVNGQPGLLPADAATLAQVAGALEALQAGGKTDHALALRRGLALRPDVLYLVTDADDLGPGDVLAVTRINGGRTAIHAVELGRAPARPDAPLRRLAEANGGSYRLVAPRPRGPGSVMGPGHVRNALDEAIRTALARRGVAHLNIPKQERCPVFNVEPAVYVEGPGGLRPNDVVALTAQGPEVLTPFPGRAEDLWVG